MRRFLGLLCISLALSIVAPAQQARWWKGNTHAHTVNSDGDSTPDAVAGWYKEHGWNFLVITDHDTVTPVDGLNAVLAAPGKFLVLTGEEVSDHAEDVPVHLVGVGLREAVRPQGGATKIEALRADTRTIRAVGGVPHVNHPNFHWALDAKDLTAATEALHFELINGGPGVNNFGGGSSPSTEELWDEVLSTGRLLYGVCTDDAHHYKGEFTRERANPGRAWVMVRAKDLSREAILAALDRGDFYASTGVTLDTYESDPSGIRIEIREGSGRNAPRFRTYFIGKDGAVLKRNDTTKPSYTFQGSELYVRARIEDSSGACAWTQPVFVKR